MPHIHEFRFTDSAVYSQWLWKLTHPTYIASHFSPIECIHEATGVCTFFITVISHLSLYPVTTSLAMISEEMCVHETTCASSSGNIELDIPDDSIWKSFLIAYIFENGPEYIVGRHVISDRQCIKFETLLVMPRQRIIYIEKR